MSLPYERRTFLKLAASLGSGLALAGITNPVFSYQPGAAPKNAKALGLQLYTLRDDIAKDPKGVLKKIASYGYTQIESFEGDKGMFWGMTNKEFKDYIGVMGMTMVSSHCDINNNFEKKAADAAEIGMKYLISPFIGAQKDMDGYKRYAEQFNRLGEICKRAGIRFAYHNHDYTFKAVDGTFPQDVLMQQTDKNLVDFEMDIYWVVTAGENPEKWLQRYPQRFKLCHVKDRKKNSLATDIDASIAVGQGQINFKKILKTAKKYGVNYYIVEQERYDNTTPLAAVEENAKYIRKNLL